MYNATNMSKIKKIIKIIGQTFYITMCIAIIVEMSGKLERSDSVIDGLRLKDEYQLNNAVQPLLTDLYQLSMAYGYWKNKKLDDIAVFDLFFRKNPFESEFTVFTGLSECLKFLRDFKFTQSDIDYLKKSMPNYIEDEFFDYLKAIDLNDIKVYAIAEGSVVFPRIPLIRVEGPIVKAQLLETTFLVLVNYASLVTTNAARFRLAAGYDKQLFEFGLRRAQGPDGALSASKYCYIGGFDATSNVLAGKLYGIPIRGTTAHSFISSFSSLNDLHIKDLKDKKSIQTHDLVELSKMYLDKVSNLFGNHASQSISGELAAFIGYALAFPSDFLVLVDTYNVLNTGVINFCAVALALNHAGYRAKGVRLDSGDLAYLSKETRSRFKLVSQEFNLPWFSQLTIVASNDINEEVLHSLNTQSHCIDCFGVGTHLVTCQKQPALGCVYKLVELNNKPCIKLSEDLQKVTFPGRKNGYRLYDKNNIAIMDLLTKIDEPSPKVGEPFLCQHPFIATKRAYLTPSKVENLYSLYWDSGKVVQENEESLIDIRNRVSKQVKLLRDDHKRHLNPTPYKITVSSTLYKFIHDLWLISTPIGEIQ